MSSNVLMMNKSTNEMIYETLIIIIIIPLVHPASQLFCICLPISSAKSRTSTCIRKFYYSVSSHSVVVPDQNKWYVKV